MRQIRGDELPRVTSHLLVVYYIYFTQMHMAAERTEWAISLVTQLARRSPKTEGHNYHRVHGHT